MRWSFQEKRTIRIILRLENPTPPVLLLDEEVEQLLRKLLWHQTELDGVDPLVVRLVRCEERGRDVWKVVGRNGGDGSKECPHRVRSRRDRLTLAWRALDVVLYVVALLVEEGERRPSTSVIVLRLLVGRVFPRGRMVLDNLFLEGRDARRQRVLGGDRRHLMSYRWAWSLFLKHRSERRRKRERGFRG